MISARCLQREMAGSFPCSLPTTPYFEICQMKHGFFSLLSTTDKTPKMPNTNAKKSALTYYYNRQGAKWPGAWPDNKKAVNLFQDLLLSMTADGWPVFTFDRFLKAHIQQRIGVPLFIKACPLVNMEAHVFIKSLSLRVLLIDRQPFNRIAFNPIFD